MQQSELADHVALHSPPATAMFARSCRPQIRSGFVLVPPDARINRRPLDFEPSACFEHLEHRPPRRKLLIGFHITIDQPIAKRGRFNAKNLVPPIHRHTSMKPPIRRPENPGARGQPHQTFTRPTAFRLFLGNLSLARLDSDIFRAVTPQTFANSNTCVPTTPG
jgi:hypothetical protein